ncbi:MAG: ferrous iron transport protein A [Chloroflexota bacterium]
MPRHKRRFTFQRRFFRKLFSGNHSFHPHGRFGREGEAHSGAMPLSGLRAGERGVVVGLEGGCWMVNRMAALGFTPGAEVTLLQNYGFGPLIAVVRETRVALGRGEAYRIKVKVGA